MKAATFELIAVTGFLFFLEACGPDNFITAPSPESDSGSDGSDAALGDETGLEDAHASSDGGDASSSDSSLGLDSSDAATCSVYSEMFMGGSISVSQCTDFTAYRSCLPAGPFTKITLSGSNDTTGRTCTGVAADTLCQGLRTGTATLPLSCDGHNWQVYVGSYGVEISAEQANVCVTGYDLRPCATNPSWGGINTVACGAPTQTITLECQ